MGRTRTCAWFTLWRRRVPAGLRRGLAVGGGGFLPGLGGGGAGFLPGFGARLGGGGGGFLPGLDGGACELTLTSR